MRPAGWRTGQARGETASPRGFGGVLGWFGAQDKHLKKYSDLLEAAGFDTGRCIAPTGVVFGTRASQRTYALQVLSATLADSAPALPIAFYLFSNGGALVYRAMLPLLVSDPAFTDVVRARHRATCFDSAPCYMHLDAGARALSEHVRSPVGKALIRCLFSCVAIVSSGFGRTDPAGEYWRDLRDDPLQAPTLYLFSDDDPLCDPQKLAATSNTRPVRQASAARGWPKGTAAHDMNMRHGLAPRGASGEPAGRRLFHLVFETGSPSSWRRGGRRARAPRCARCGGRCRSTWATCASTRRSTRRHCWGS
jgi:hypothetical protein